MQQWEYMHLRISINDAGKERVVSLNGQEIDKVTSAMLGFNDKAKGEEINNRLGEDRWELVTYTPSGTAYSAILKRPTA